MDDRYRPLEYWSELLASDFTLRGTGHVSYSRGYNEWMYRRKAKVLGRALGAISRRRNLFSPPLAEPSSKDQVLEPRALDVGSGTGWVVEQLLAWGAVVEGSDLTAVSVSRLTERFPDVVFFRFALGSSAVPRAEGTYELVTLMDVAYHVTDDELWQAGIVELARVIAPGGFLVATDCFGVAERDPAAHVRFRSMESWASATEPHGLRLTILLPLYRWLSRDLDELRFPDMPHRLRGMLEYVLETIAPRKAHLSLAVFQKAQDPTRTAATG